VDKKVDPGFIFDSATDRYITLINNYKPHTSTNKPLSYLFSHIDELHFVKKYGVSVSDIKGKSAVSLAPK
jgi:hypothetical protein